MHQLLRHLEAGGLPLTPRLVGEDAEHEYLTYLPGTPVFRPWPETVLSDVWLGELGRWLRAYHDAVYARTIEYVRTLQDADLDRVVDTSWDPPVTLGVRLVSVVNDDQQHVGQAAFVRGLLGDR